MAITTNSDGTFTIVGADYTGATDSTAAIQAAINDVNTNYGGGILWLPRPGNYMISGGITIQGGVDLRGHGREVTALNGQSSNTNTVTVTGPANGGLYPGFRDIFVQGYIGTNRTSNAVVVNPNCPAQLRDSQIWFGYAAIYTQGMDGIYDNLFISGASASNIGSVGANWWHRCKVDTSGSHTTYGFLQGSVLPGFSIAENHFDMCDFSGDYTESIAIADQGASTATTFFSNCVFSSPVHIYTHKVTGFSGCEFGSTITAQPNTMITGSIKFGTSISVPSAVKAANINIT